MSEDQTLLLGLIAGSTILLGLPVGRLRTPRPGLRQLLNAVTVGILLFLVWDVLSQAYEPLAGALRARHDGTGALAPVLGFAALVLAGWTAGLTTLVLYERWLAGRTRRTSFGPGAMTPGEVAA